MMNDGLYKSLTTISYSLTVAAVLIILFTSGSSGSAELSALQYSYIILSCSMMFMFWLLWSKTDDGSIKGKIISLFPFIMIMITSVAIALLLFIYFDSIIKGVSSYYSLFLNTSTMITIVQIIMMYNAINGNYFLTHNSINPKIFSLMMLIGTINLITVITLGVVLKYYATDC